MNRRIYVCQDCGEDSESAIRCPACRGENLTRSSFDWYDDDDFNEEDDCELVDDEESYGYDDEDDDDVDDVDDEELDFN